LQTPISVQKEDRAHHDHLSAEVEREWFGQPRILEHV
jgi:hypothetical protein